MTGALLVLLAAAPVSSAAEAPPLSGTATLPLAELGPLLRRAEAGAPEAPADAVVGRLTLKAHPDESGLWVEGEVTVRLLSGSRARVPLVRVGPEVSFDELAATETAVLSVSGGMLVASAFGATATLPFKLLLRARADGANRAVSLQLAPGLPPAPLRVEVDDALFALQGAAVVREWGGWVVFPRDGAYALAWSNRVTQPRAEVQRRAPVEPGVTQATSRWVSTLEGRATHELKLALRVDRPTELTVSVPGGQRLLSARVNGEPAAVGEAREVTLKVAPGSLGGSEALVELALVKELGVFHLSGRFDLEAPRLSLPVRLWRAEVMLPAVFNYAREGGSMEQVAPEGAESSDVPGKALAFTQHLIQASAPVLALSYSVDISKSYFR